MFAVKNFQSFSNEAFESEKLVLAFKFNGRHHLEYLLRVVLPYCSDTKSDCSKLSVKIHLKENNFPLVTDAIKFTMRRTAGQSSPSYQDRSQNEANRGTCLSHFFREILK